MTITLNGIPVGSFSSLSEKTTTVFMLIPDAVLWLEWAMHSTEQFDFRNEADMVQSVQNGLHGTDLLSLSGVGLLASPLKLLELEETELRRLLEGEQGDEANGVLGVRNRRILDIHGLITCEELSVVDEFMDRHDLVGTPFLQAMTLADRIAMAVELTSLASAASTDRRSQRVAAEFAAQHAVSAGEFADYYKMFLRLSDRLDATPAATRRSVQVARVNLARSAPNCYRCPVFAAPPTCEGLYEQLLIWLGAGYPLGFKTVARCVAQVVENSSGTYQEVGEAARSVAEVFGEIQVAIQAAPPSRFEIGQDGSTLTYTVDVGGFEVKLLLDSSCQLTVGALQTHSRQSRSAGEEA